MQQVAAIRLVHDVARLTSVLLQGAGVQLLPQL